MGVHYRVTIQHPLVSTAPKPPDNAARPDAGEDQLPKA
jgi:hypothetical protein